LLPSGALLRSIDFEFKRVVPHKGDREIDLEGRVESWGVLLATATGF
jgi:hypothetical protein